MEGCEKKGITVVPHAFWLLDFHNYGNRFILNMDQYIILRKIGSGSYGVAYLGCEKKSGVRNDRVLISCYSNCMYSKK